MAKYRSKPMELNEPLAKRNVWTANTAATTSRAGRRTEWFHDPRSPAIQGTSMPMPMMAGQRRT